jgi:hypothetical protein
MSALLARFWTAPLCSCPCLVPARSSGAYYSRVKLPNHRRDRERGRRVYGRPCVEDGDAPRPDRPRPRGPPIPPAPASASAPAPAPDNSTGSFSIPRATGGTPKPRPAADRAAERERATVRWCRLLPVETRVESA